MNAPFGPTHASIADSLAPADGAPADGGAGKLTSYRPFIDGLRAVSILAVVLSHAGVPGIGGGFVGVDVFFVISGFLIISQIVEGLARGSFSFGEFWARRALRILPPYLLVVAFSIAAAPFALILSDEFKQLAREARDGGLMTINHLLLGEQGYFDTASDAKVLLNLWSLAVEEQFYLVAPLLLALAWWLPRLVQRPELRPKLLFWGAALIAGASFAGSIAWTVQGGRNYGFYLAGLRAWEFVAGGAVGFFVPYVVGWPKSLRSLLGIAGLAAIVAAATLYTPQTLYPSWRAALPVLGAAAVILSGISNSAGLSARLLATPPMIWIGLVSYSWYLWHWPLLALVRVANFGERDFPTDLSVVACSLVLAVATYWLVERPIRRWRQQRRVRLGWTPALAGVALAAATAFAGYQTAMAYARNSERTVEAAFKPLALPPAEMCDLSTESAETCLAMAHGRPTVLLIGDSQMLFGSNGLASFLDAHGMLAVRSALPGCGAFLGVRILIVDRGMRDTCDAGRRHFMNELSRGVLKPQMAILYSLWQGYSKEFQHLVPDSDQPFDRESLTVSEAMHTTLATLGELGVERTLIIGPTPVFPRPAPFCIAQATRWNKDWAAECALDRRGIDEQRRTLVQSQLREASADASHVRFVEVIDDFCDARWCIPYADGRALFTDIHHPGDAAMTRMTVRQRGDFDWLLGR